MKLSLAMRARCPACLLLPLLGTTLLLLAACANEEAAPGTSSAFDSSAVQKDTTFDASLTQIFRRQKRFRVFSTLLDSAGVLPMLQHGGPYTVFAATDPGIEKMPNGLVDELLLPANRERLRQLMAYHIHRGQLAKDSLRGTDSLSTMAGRALPVALEGGRVLAGGERVSEYVITGSNGRIFALDALLMPPVSDAPTQLPASGTYDSLGSDNSAGENASGEGSSPDASEASNGNSSTGNTDSGSGSSGSGN